MAMVLTPFLDLYKMDSNLFNFHIPNISSPAVTEK